MAPPPPSPFQVHKGSTFKFTQSQTLGFQVEYCKDENNNGEGCFYFRKFDALSPLAMFSSLKKGMRIVAINHQPCPKTIQELQHVLQNAVGLVTIHAAEMNESYYHYQQQKQRQQQDSDDSDDVSTTAKHYKDASPYVEGPLDALKRNDKYFVDQVTRMVMEHTEGRQDTHGHNMDEEEDDYYYYEGEVEGGDKALRPTDRRSSLRQSKRRANKTKKRSSPSSRGPPKPEGMKVLLPPKPVYYDANDEPYMDATTPAPPSFKARYYDPPPEESESEESDSDAPTDDDDDDDDKNDNSKNVVVSDVSVSSADEESDALAAVVPKAETREEDESSRDTVSMEDEEREVAAIIVQQEWPNTHRLRNHEKKVIRRRNRKKHIRRQKKFVELFEKSLTGLFQCAGIGTVATANAAAAKESSSGHKMYA
eukprot:scaffold2858_cov109-Cylindrotheca_fusiformis.AAC.5